MTAIEYVCYTNLSGYGTAAKNTIKALLHDGSYDIRLCSLNLDFGREASEADGILYEKLIQAKSDPNRIQIFHCIPDLQRRFRRCIKTIGVAVYETMEPPAHWVAILNKNDAVIVPSEFNRQIFLNAGVSKPIFYIPHCIDMDVFTPNAVPIHSYDRFTFLYFGAWRWRKGYKEMLNAWETFKQNDPVQLIIKTDRSSDAKAYLRHIPKGLAPVIVDEQRYSDSEIPGMIRSADCMICPTRGEGFGLPPLQSMAVGVPVIVTNATGCSEYANPETATLLEPEGTEFVKCLDGIPQFSKKKWITISSKQIANSMRYAFAHRQEIQEKADNAVKYVSTKFGYNTLSELFGRMLSDVT